MAYIKNPSWTLLQSFIKRRFKNVEPGTFVIGFSSQKQLFNIFEKMFSTKSKFFSQLAVRKILSSFWFSIREIFLGLKLRRQAASGKPSMISKLSAKEEPLLENNFYVRLELASRGRQIYEPFSVM